MQNLQTKRAGGHAGGTSPRNLLKLGAPTPQCRSGRGRRRAKRGAAGARLWRAGLRTSADFPAVERAVGPVGRVGAATS
eukprot:844709-Alexandrium_andersonii.AAC.1